MKGPAKKAIAYAESRGFAYERTNTKGFLYYRHNSGVEVGISPGLGDKDLAHIRRECDRAEGIGPDLTQKRKPDQIKSRAARQHELDRLRGLAREKRDLLLDGAGARLSSREVSAITREIESHERRIREIEQLMRPAAGAA